MPAHFIDPAEAARRLPSAERVLVIGCSGGGKTTLSRRLAARFGLRHMSMDAEVFWLPGWVQRDRAEQRRLIEELVSQPRWIMDGTNTSSFDLRLPRTDLVVWVKMPRWLCLRSVVWRWLRHLGRTRPEMAPNCPERVSREFVRYIWTFETEQTPKILAGFDTHSGEMPVLVLKSRDETARLLDLAGASA